MLGAESQRSEVARLLAQIDAEQQSARRGLSELAQGVARHDFITAKMEHIGELHSELHALVGDVAIAMIAEQEKTGPGEERGTLSGAPCSSLQGHNEREGNALCAKRAQEGE